MTARLFVRTGPETRRSWVWWGDYDTQPDAARVVERLRLRPHEIRIDRV